MQVSKASPCRAAPLLAARAFLQHCQLEEQHRGFLPSMAAPQLKSTPRDRYLSKTFSSQLRLMSTQSGTFTRMPRSSSSLS